VPRKEPRWLRRNALIAAGNVGTPDLADAVAGYAESDDPVLRDTAAWALDRLAARSA
jgi:epoxyqueuosine reductase